MLATKKQIGIAVVVLLAVVGSTVSLLTLSAQEPVMPISEGEATDESTEVTYCDSRPDGITVQGSGVVTLPANIGVVELGVDVIADPLIDARLTAASAMQGIIDAVKEQGVTDDQITTTRLRISPERTWVEEEFDLGDGSIGRRNRDVIIGYRVSNRVRIEIDFAKIAEADASETQTSDAEMSESDDSDILSAVIDAAVTAGGDNVRIDSIYFTADQTAESVDEARKLAVEDALHRAELYAESFGVEVGILMSASEVVTATPVFSDFPAAAARYSVVESEALSTPINAGDVSVTANITAKFAIQSPQGCVDKTRMSFDKSADDKDATKDSE